MCSGRGLLGCVPFCGRDMVGERKRERRGMWDERCSRQSLYVASEERAQSQSVISRCQSPTQLGRRPHPARARHLPLCQDVPCLETHSACLEVGTSVRLSSLPPVFNVQRQRSTQLGVSIYRSISGSVTKGFKTSAAAALERAVTD